MHRNPVYLSVLAALAMLPALAETTPTTEDVVVTAARIPTPRKGLAALTTVITAEDIRQSAARTIPELLAAEIGLSAFSMSGTDDRSMDRHGFGVAGISNVQLLVNGVPQKDNDLTPPRLTHLALADIERIEVQGGAGAVLYGSGATAGVINIITRNPLKSQPRATVSLMGGSYGTREGVARLNLGDEQWALTLGANKMHTRHYRDFNAEDRHALSADFRWRGEHDSVQMFAASGQQQLQLPGSISWSDYEKDPRQRGSYVYTSWLHDRQLQIGYQHEFGPHRLDLDLARRSKHSEASYGSASTLRSTTLAPRVTWKWGEGVKHQLTVGADFGISRNDVSGSTYSTASQRYRALFINEQMDFTGGTQLLVGGRSQRVLSQTVTSSKTMDDDQHLTAFDLGVSQPLWSSVEGYVRGGRSFRIPNADEVTSVTKDGLRPQRSRDLELGFKGKFGGGEWRANLFRHDLTDEIHYNPLVNNTSGNSGANMNLQPTRHQGLELSGDWAITPDVKLTGNALWQQAIFRSGVYGGTNLAGKRIPVVPKRIFNLGVHWQINAETDVSLSGRYVSERIADDDQKNTASRRLPSYRLLDLKLGQRYRDWSWQLAVNNLQNRKYVEYGGAYGIYPSPTRSVFLTLEYQVQ